MFKPISVLVFQLIIESRIMRLIAILLLGLLLFFLIKTYFFQPEFELVEYTGDLNSGFEEVPRIPLQAHQQNLSGYLYFDAQVPLLTQGEGDTDLVLQSYLYSILNKDIYSVLPNIFSSKVIPTATNTIMLITTPVDDNDIDTIIQPILLDTKTGIFNKLIDVTDIPIGLAYDTSTQRIAFELVENNNTIDNNNLYTNIKNRYILFYNPYLQQDIFITAATSPQWLNGAQDLIYAANDGIYRYNLKTNTTSSFLMEFQNLDTYVDITISPNSQYMVITLPLLNAMALYQIIEDQDTTLVSKIGIIQNSDIVYTTPVFSPDSRYYAVMMKKVPTFKRKEKAVLANNIGIYALDNNVPVKILSLPDEFSTATALSAWSTYVVPVLNIDDTN